MTAIEAINYFDHISSMPQQEAFKESWRWMALIFIAAIIFGLTNQCIDKFIFKKDEKSIIDNCG